MSHATDIVSHVSISQNSQISGSLLCSQPPATSESKAWKRPEIEVVQVKNLWKSRAWQLARHKSHQENGSNMRGIGIQGSDVEGSALARLLK